MVSFAAIDIIDRIELFAHLQSSLLENINKDAINLIICYAYKEADMLSYSSHCITVSAMATEIRCKKQLDSFDDILRSISPASLREEVSRCAEMLLEKMKKFSYFACSPATGSNAMEVSP
jgi:hypothetical protein